MLELLQRFAAWLMNGVRVNQTKRGMRNGVPVYIKRRRAGGGLMIRLGNRFLSLARSGVRMFVRADEWMEWEVYCSGLLYPDQPRAQIEPGAAVSIAEVNGTSLRQLIGHNETDLRPLTAAARELRRVHQIPCRWFGAAWSHGDLHLDNILYDPVTDRAVLIDFDTRHESDISPVRRHSDDLSVFLLELIGHPDDNWFERAMAFVKEYREPSVLRELNQRLVVSRGFAGILMLTRTRCASIRRTGQRMERLRRQLDQMTATTDC